MSLSARSSRAFEVPPVSEIRPTSEVPCLLVCEHASAYIPAVYDGLGLSADQIQTHIGWDPGAFELAQGVSQHLGCSLVASNYSRLLIDCNRPTEVASCIVAQSEHIVIPGNQQVSDQERMRRINSIHCPFHKAVLGHVERLKRVQSLFPVIGIHSFTPVFLGQARPWEFSVMFTQESPFVSALRRAVEQHPTQIAVGYNEPYCARSIRAHTTEYCSDDHGLPAVIFEVRQDLLQGSAQRHTWQQFIASLIRSAWAEARR